MSATKDHPPSEVSLRCSICGYDWPLVEDYRTCPCCLEQTDRCRGVRPMDEDEAFSLKVQFDFERFYEQWDAERPAERLDPSQ